MTLNKITNDGAKNLANYYETSPRYNGTDRYEAFFTLGLLAWRARDTEKSAALLADASKEVVDVVASRDISDAADPRTPRRLAIPFLMALQFGDEATRTRLAAVPRSQWNHPETDEYKPLADLLEVLMGYATKKPLNSETLRNLVALNEYPGSDLDSRPWIAALARGLLAVAERNPAQARTHLLEPVELHEVKAIEGDWKKLVEGLLSFWAMTLHKVAANEGIALGVVSPYFPA